MSLAERLMQDHGVAPVAKPAVTAAAKSANLWMNPRPQGKRALAGWTRPPSAVLLRRYPADTAGLEACATGAAARASGEG